MKHRYLGATAVTAGLAALLLAGCGSKDAPDDQASGSQTTSAEEAMQEAAKLERPQPGQYEQKVEITNFAIPGMSAAQGEQMKSMMANASAKNFCLTKEDADKGYKDMLDKLPGDSQCAYTRFEVSGGKLDAALECKDKTGATARATMAGVIGPDGSDVKLDMEQAMPGMADKKATISMHMATRRLGDCAS